MLAHDRLKSHGMTIVFKKYARGYASTCSKIHLQ
jgi:hypothetical protein